MTSVHLKLFYVVLIGLILADQAQCTKYKPVVLLHGILSGNLTMELIAARIKEKHPGTIVHNIGMYSYWSSLSAMWKQVNDIGNYFLNITSQYSQGVNLLGYSQGGLVARAILQAFPNHSVNTFISLSSPQAGQFGDNFLHLIFPNLICRTAYEVFYSHIGQHTSVGNYWNDPAEQKLYYKYSQFLPFVNNELNTSSTRDFKSGIVKLKRMVLIGGPNDGIIQPWQSSQFGYFNDTKTVVDIRNRDIYIKDTIGLRYLDEKKRLKLITVPNVSHFQWHLDVDIVDRYILPYLN